MKIIKVKAMDDCLDRVVTKEFSLSRPTDQTWISSLDTLGDLEYFGHFPRPFYRLTAKGKYILKGVEGNDKCQVTFLNYSQETETSLINRLNRLGDASS